jgi:hypothetical protein
MNNINQLITIQDKIQTIYRNILKAEYVDDDFINENYNSVLENIVSQIDSDYLLVLYNQILQGDIPSMIRLGDILLEKAPFDPKKTKEEIDTNESNLIWLGLDWDYCRMDDDIRTSIEKNMDETREKIKELKTNETFILRFKYIRLAYFYFRVASEFDDPEALWRLGWRYILCDFHFRSSSGHNKKMDAVACWQKAAAAEHQQAIDKLREMNVSY